jgi:pyrroline-5-carboxylate reductase
MLKYSMGAGISKAGLLPAKDIYIFDKYEPTLAEARAKGHGTVTEIKELFAVCDVVAFLIKPKIFRELKPELMQLDTRGKRIITPMAAVHTDEVREVFSCPVLRLMPTLAVSEASDIIGYCSSDIRAFDDILEGLSRLGTTVSLDDDDMLDRLTVVASCGLGFAAHIMEVYKNECIKFGFSEEQSEAIARRIFSFSAYTASFSDLERRVATKGGATEAGILAMDADLKKSISAAFTGAAERAVPKK